jgi:hypothetical protein
MDSEAKRERPRRTGSTWLMILCAGVLACLALFLLWPREPRVGRTNFDKIQAGWTLAQVEALLGPGREIGSLRFWGEIDHDTIMITLDGDRRVVEKHYLPDNLTARERLYRAARRKAREALGMPVEP